MFWVSFVNYCDNCSKSRHIEFALIGLTVGAFLRIHSFSSLIIGSILVGIGITGINVLLPAIVADKYPNRAGSITGMYSIATTLFSAIAAYAIMPISHSSWQTGLIIVALIACFTVIFWVPNLRYNRSQADTSTTSSSKIKV